ncbi:MULTISPECIES: N-acetylmuramidase [unclassified Iodidimonas]|uniref:glycoside hydrolase family 108 protein n=1 Tax=unclassified Iodidimonas TaxID=2626145 RepID=UPI0024826E53|nr:MULTISPECIES: N-acetylmuramidase [unclassified Iodidimonas]
MNHDQILDDILRREGGFVDDPDDPGGPTNLGITLKTLSDWRQASVDVDDLRAMSRDEAKQIYAARYIKDPGLDRLPPAVQPILIDAAVHMGPTEAIRLLQRVLNAVSGPAIAEDGLMGPLSRTRAQSEYERLGPAFLASLLEERRRFYFRLTARRPVLAKFLRGWLNRLADFNVEKSLLNSRERGLA